MVIPQEQFSGINSDSLADQRRKRFIVVVSIIGIVAVGVQFVLSILTGGLDDLVFMGGILIALSFVLYFARKNRLQLAANIIVCIAIFGVFWAAYNDGKNDGTGASGLFFFFEFPTLSFFLLRKRQGLRWMLVLVGLVFVAFLLSSYNILFQQFIFKTWLYFGLCYAVVVTMVYFYQDLVEASEKAIATRDKQLAKERDQAKAVVTSIGEGLFVVDTAKRIISINPTTEELLGITSERILNQPIDSIFPLFKKDKAFDQDKYPGLQPLTDGKIAAVDLDDDIICHAPSGRKFPVSFVASPILRVNEVTGVVVVFRDITTDKQATEFIEREVKIRTQEVHEGQARLLASINSLTMGYIMTNHVPEITMQNNAAELILQKANLLSGSKKNSVAPASLTLEKLDALMGDAVNLMAQVKDCIAHQKEVQLDNLEYNNMFLELFISPIVLEKKVIGTVVLIQDVTEARILERSKDELFSIASHELRTPLAAIRGYSSLMEKRYAKAVGDSKLKDMVTGIHNSSIRLIDIVNDFLDTSRLEQKRIDFNFTQFNLVTLVHDIAKEYTELAQEKKIKLVISKSIPESECVYADQERTKQILINLIGNALKFTEKGSIMLDVFSKGGALGVRVIDTGKGIVPENQTLLFRKFQQAGQDLITRDASRGTGLGLYISKLLVEGMGGKIWLEHSVVGKGSSFAFVLQRVVPKTKSAM